MPNQAQILLTLAILLVFLVWAHRRSRQPAGWQATVPAAALVAETTYTGPFAFFRRHYHGDYSLARSYWLNTLLLQVAAGTAGLAVLPLLGKNFPARFASQAFIVFYFGTIALWLWAARGTWASAGKHVARGGRPGMASLAKIILVLGLLRTVAQVAGDLPMLREHGDVALGHQLGPATRLEVRADGQSILLTGGINDGSAQQLEDALKLAPNVRTLVLNSNGGWIREGEMLAKVVRAHHLNTYVENFCASACTMAFLAGADRAVAPSAKLGFHSSRVVGAQGASPESPRFRAFYVDAGLPASFIDRALKTPPGEMWTPTIDELQSAGVVTRRSLGGETAALATAINARADLEQKLAKEPIFAALAQRDPKAYQAMLDVAWGRLGAGATDAEFTMAIRQATLPVVLSYVPLATDETLAAYQALLVEQAHALQKADAEACVELAFPSGKAMKLVGLMPPALRERETALMTRSLGEADETRRIRPTVPDVQAVVRAAAARFTPEQWRIFADPSLRAHAPVPQVCATAVAFFDGLGSLPPPQRAYAMRVLFSPRPLAR